MPTMDAFIPTGALKPKAEAHLMKELTDILVSLEGIEPENERARGVSVIFLHRPEIYVAGVPATAARYRFVPWVAKGQYDDEVRRLVVKAVTEAVARAEGPSPEDVAARVWVSPNEIVDTPSSGRMLGVGPNGNLDAPDDRE